MANRPMITGGFAVVEPAVSTHWHRCEEQRISHRCRKISGLLGAQNRERIRGNCGRLSATRPDVGQHPMLARPEARAL